MPRILKPFDEPEKVSKKNVVIHAEPALVVHKDQLKTISQLKQDVLKESERRKKLTEATTDEEFKQLYEIQSR
jgi:mannitol/fructose-specific phosphotransferase system IIA component (Ntr-type)